MVYISQDGVRLSNYMFWPAIVAIIRLQSLMLTHRRRVTQNCVFTLQLCRTGDADLRF
jgi:hypothetical protein